MLNALPTQSYSMESCFFLASNLNHQASITLASNLNHQASITSINARKHSTSFQASSSHKPSFCNYNLKTRKSQRKTQAHALAMATNVDEGVKVLGVRFSPFVIRVLVALDLKGIHYDFIEEKDMQNKSELLLKMNPVHKKIPVMIHDGKPVCESLIIVQYIDEVWTASHPLLPSDPYERSQARFWSAFIDDKVIDSLRRIFANPDKETQRKAIEDANHNFGLLEGALKDTFGGKAYFGGDKVGLVDIALGSLVGIIKASESLGNTVLIDEQKTPLLAAWLALFEETDGVKGNLPDPNILIEFFRKRFHSQPAP